MFPNSRWRTKSSVSRTWRVGNSRVTVGRFTCGTRHLDIREWGEGSGLDVGSFCSIATSVTIFLGGNHRTDWIATYPFGRIFAEFLGGTDIKGHSVTRGSVTIGHDVWIGHGCTIMSGVTVGNGAVLAANTTLNQDVPPYSIVAGNPGRVVKYRFPENIVELLQKLAWWDLPLEVIRKIALVLCCEPNFKSVATLLMRYR